MSTHSPCRGDFSSAAFACCSPGGIAPLAGARAAAGAASLAASCRAWQAPFRQPRQRMTRTAENVVSGFMPQIVCRALPGRQASRGLSEPAAPIIAAEAPVPLRINGQRVDDAVLNGELANIKSYFESLGNASCCERD